MPCWGSAERKAEMLAKYRTDPDKWFQRPDELAHVAFRPYFEQYTISKTRPKRQSIEVYEDAKGFFVYLRQKSKKHLVAVRSAPACPEFTSSMLTPSQRSQMLPVCSTSFDTSKNACHSCCRAQVNTSTCPAKQHPRCCPDLRSNTCVQVTLPKLNTAEFYARLLLLYADLDWSTVRNWKDLRTDPESGDVLTFAAMAKLCGLLLDHKTAELTLDEARAQQLLTPYRARILFCSVRS